MKEAHHIDELFKNGLDHLETPVDVQMWTRLNTQLQHTAIKPHGTTVVKSIFTTTKLWVAAAIVAATVAVGIWVNNHNTSADTNHAENKNTPIHVEESPIANSSNNKTPVAEKPTTTKSVTDQLKEKLALPLDDTTSGSSNITLQEPTATEAEAQRMNEAEPKDGSTADDNNHASEPKKEMANQTTTAIDPQVNKQEQGTLGAITVDDEQVTLPQKWTTPQFNENITINTNIITPNGDGKNDVFEVHATNTESFNLLIYDRSGKVVAEFHTADVVWDGKTKNGKESDADTYFYFIFGMSNTGQSFDKKGTLTIR